MQYCYHPLLHIGVVESGGKTTITGDSISMNTGEMTTTVKPGQTSTAASDDSVSFEPHNGSVLALKVSY